MKPFHFVRLPWYNDLLLYQHALGFSEAQQTLWLIMLLRGQRLIKLPLAQEASISRDSGCPICGGEQRRRSKSRKALLWGHWEGQSLGFKDKRHSLTSFAVPAMLSAPEHWDINSWPVNSHSHHLPFTTKRKEQGLWPRARWANRLPRPCQGHNLNIPHFLLPFFFQTILMESPLCLCILFSKFLWAQREVCLVTSLVLRISLLETVYLKGILAKARTWSSKSTCGNEMFISSWMEH